MQYFMSTNASRKQKKKKKKVLQTSGSGRPLSCSKKFASFYETSVYSERMQKKSKVTHNMSSVNNAAVSQKKINVFLSYSFFLAQKDTRTLEKSIKNDLVSSQEQKLSKNC